MTRLALQMAVVTMILAGCGIVLSMPASPRAQLRPTFACPHHLSGVFGDVGDGDSKTVVVRGATMTITPHEAPTEHWKVEAAFDPKTCRALVDFSVPGKPNPPPCSLVATVWEMAGPEDKTKYAIEFTDPTNACKFGEPGSPLNEWILYTHKDGGQVPATA